MKDSFSTVVWGWQIANQLIADGKDPFDTKVLGDALANLGSYHVVGRPPVDCAGAPEEYQSICYRTRDLPACGTATKYTADPDLREQVHRRHRADERGGQEQPAQDGLTGTLDRTTRPAPGRVVARHRIRSSRA